MAELHRVEINEKVQSEVEPDDAAEAVGTISEEPAGEEQQVDRPEWLPEKFKSPEDMANAYSELEKKMGQGTNEEQSAETTEEASLEMVAIQPISTFWFNTLRLELPII